MNRLFKSFRYAWQGIRAVVAQEANMKIHVSVVVVVIVFGVFFNISNTEWIAISICIGLVLSAEMFNTAIELLVDKVSPERNPVAGKVKDIAAGAVLITVFMSVVVGFIIFVPEMLNWLFG